MRVHRIIPADLVDPVRFWSLVNRDDPSGCWIWLGAHYTRGYGQYAVNGHNYPAHRLAWTLINGQIPDGLVICHRCDNPPCVRPDHLFAGTYGDNSRDASAKGRLSGVVGLKPRAFCKKGHPMEGVNIVCYIRKTGYVQRDCLTCKRPYQRTYQRAYQRMRREQRQAQGWE